MGYISKIKDTGGTEHPVSLSLYGTCSTAAGTAAKVVTCTDWDTAAANIPTGTTIHVKFTNANTVASPTLNINSKGAINIYRYGTTATGTTAAIWWEAGSIVSFTYDGSAWIINSYKSGDVNHNTDTKVTSAANHYAPAEDSTAQLSADASGGAAATWNSTLLVTGVDIKRDAKGHVTGIAVDSIKMPANPHVDGKNIVGSTSTATANATTATTNTATFLNHIENTTVKSYTLVKGAGGTTVAAQSGVVTITGLSIGTTATTAMAGNTAVNKVNVSAYHPTGASIYVYPTFALSSAVDTNTTLRYNNYISYTIRYSNNVSTRCYSRLILGGPSVVDDVDPTIILSSAVYGATRYYSLNNGYATVRANMDVSTSAIHTLGTTDGTIVDDGSVVTDNVNRPILLANCSTGSTPGTAPLTNRNNSIYANGSTGFITTSGYNVLSGSNVKGVLEYKSSLDTLTLDTGSSTNTKVEINSPYKLILSGGTQGTEISGNGININSGVGLSLLGANVSMSGGGCSIALDDNSGITLLGPTIDIGNATSSNNTIEIGHNAYSTTQIRGKTVEISSSVSGAGSVAISATGGSGGSVTIGAGGDAGKITVGGASGTGTITITSTGNSGKVNITAKSWTSTSATTAGIDSNGKLVKVSSARRYKDYIDYDIDKEDYHNLLMAFEPCTYEYKELPGEQNLGFIAEDIYEINPLLVNYNDDFEIESYRDKDITAMLIMEAQRKDKEIEDLKQQINNLTYLVNQLMNGNVNNE